MVVVAVIGFKAVVACLVISRGRKGITMRMVGTCVVVWLVRATGYRWQQRGRMTNASHKSYGLQPNA